VEQIVMFLLILLRDVGFLLCYFASIVLVLISLSLCTFNLVNSPTWS